MKDQERFLTMAKAYDVMASKFVPKYKFLQEEIFNIVHFDKNESIRVLDLGAGSGNQVEKILNEYPNSTCYWLDSSPKFKEIAEQKLSKFGDRVQFILADFNDHWEQEIGSKFDMIVSMSAIHHLSSDEKRAIYKKAYDQLATNGWFLNIDEMKTINSGAYKNSLYFWVNHVEAQNQLISVEKKDLAKIWVDHFENWKKRNIDGINNKKVSGDDIHDLFVDQVEWLNKIGYKNPDVFVKYHLWCIIGGQK